MDMQNPEIIFSLDGDKTNAAHVLAMTRKGLSPELIKSMGRSSLTRLDLNSILLVAEKDARWDKKFFDS